MTPPNSDEIAALSREVAIVTDAAAQILWADSRAGTLLGARPGRNLADVCLPGMSDKAVELVNKAGRESLRAWELGVLLDDKPATMVFAGRPWNGHALLVGELISNEYQGAIGKVQQTIEDIVSLNRAIVRQKQEISRYADRLEESHRDLQESNQGVLALHRELDDRAEALSRSGEIKSRVVSSVSREFRTPLNSVLALTELLLDEADGELNDEQRKQVRFIRSSAFWLKPIDQERLLRKLKSLVRLDRPVKVLVIDDDERARYLIRKHVDGQPHELFEAATGEEGTRIARDEMPNVILLDFLLENGTAFDVLDELKADPRTRSIPVIIVTSHVLGDAERKLLAAGTEAVISKQNLSRELAINRIRDALRKSGMEARL